MLKKCILCLTPRAGGWVEEQQGTVRDHREIAANRRSGVLVVIFYCTVGRLWLPNRTAQHLESFDREAVKLRPYMSCHCSTSCVDFRIRLLPRKSV